MIPGPVIWTLPSVMGGEGGPEEHLVKAHMMEGLAEDTSRDLTVAAVPQATVSWTTSGDFAADLMLFHATFAYLSSKQLCTIV